MADQVDRKMPKDCADSLGDLVVDLVVDFVVDFLVDFVQLCNVTTQRAN